MSDPFVAEIRIFPFNFPPTGWAFCAGQLLPISQNTAVFSLLGTFYGGDGKSNFALPNFHDSAPMQQGQGLGLTDRFVGETGGSSTVTLITSEIPAHTHSLIGSNGASNSASPFNASWSASSYRVYAPGTATKDTAMGGLALSPTGGSLPHNNMPPYLALNFCIALQGIFPARG